MFVIPAAAYSHSRPISAKRPGSGVDQVSGVFLGTIVDQRELFPLTSARRILGVLNPEGAGSV